MFIYLLLITVLVPLINCEEKVRYDGFQVYRVVPKSREAVAILKTLEETNVYDFWSSVSRVGDNVDIMVPPHYKYRFNDSISSSEFESEIFISDVQKLIDNETPRKRRKSRNLNNWEDYASLEEINQFLYDLEEQYPDKVTVINIGKSYEENDILGVKVIFGPGNANRSVFIESHIHAREWITSATVTWILNQLLTSEDPDVRGVADSHDWYIVPVTNPDGFLYTQIDRMWRKTRTPNFLCMGVDPNRNWAYEFQAPGASDFPCSQTYRGPEPFSEPSTRVLSEYIKTVGPQLQAYLSIHSYSQLLLIPYSYSSERLDNYQELYDIGIKAADKLRERYGTNYRVGNTVDILYVASGVSVDWVKGNYGTRLTYTYELRDTGAYGFILPPDQIIPCAEETLDSLVTLFQELDKL